MSKLTPAFEREALRRGYLVRSKKQVATPLPVAQAATLEFLNLGFQVDQRELEGAGVERLTSWLQEARELMGSDRDLEPIYPGFPEQVEDLPTLTLLAEQLLHYWSGGVLLPSYPTSVREGLPLEDMLRTSRRLEVRSAAEVAREVITSLTLQAVAMSPAEQELLREALLLEVLPLPEVSRLVGEARNGENMQTFLEGVFLTREWKQEEFLQAVLPHCKTSDQLLRVILLVASKPSAPKWEENYKRALKNLSSSDARAVRMERLSRPSRRLLVAELARVTPGFQADYLVGRKHLWRGVMRAVHPHDFSLDEASKRAVDIIHGDSAHRTLNSLVEEGLAQESVTTVVELLKTHRPGELVKRLVTLLRLVKTDAEAHLLTTAVVEVGKRTALTTLIGAYNGLLVANSAGPRVTRVAGRMNTLVNHGEDKKVSEKHVSMVQAGLLEALGQRLKGVPAPRGPVAILGEAPVPLVRRDYASAERTLERGTPLALVGEGDILRLFGHWRNNQDHGGYMDVGAVVLDEHFASLAVCTWNSWESTRSWAVYSGDKHVDPGDEAAEYVDVKLASLQEAHPEARYVALTVQSWSGWPTCAVDFLAGAMLRSEGQKGQVFDARTVVTAFKPTTAALSSVPLVVDLKSRKLIWLDTSSGSTQAGCSAASDFTVGPVVADGLRPRLTQGDFARLWAEAHGVETLQEEVKWEDLQHLLQ